MGLGCVKTRRRAILIEEVIRPSLLSRSKRKRIQLRDRTEKYHSSSRFDFCVFTQPGSLADIRRARADVRSTPGSGRQSQAPARLTWANIGSANHQFDVVVTSFVNSRPTKVLVVMRASAATMLACPMKPNPRADYCGAKIAQRASNQQADGDETRATVQRSLASATPAARIVPAR